MTMLKPLMAPLLPMIEPTLDLDLTAEYLDPRITFTRASTKTYYDSAGTMRTAAVNEWPVEYDPSTVTRVNLLTRSQDFDNAAWSKFGASVIANAATAPDGSVTADKIVEASDVGQNHRVQQATPVYAIGVGVTFAASVCLKSAERTHAFASVGMLGEEYTLAIDLAAGVVTATTSASAPISPFYSITALADGWFRVVIGFTNEDFGHGATWRFGPLDGPTLNAILPTYNGNGTSGIYAWGAQVEVGTAATEYIPTGATPAGNGVCIGRSVWEQRTNLLERSQEFDNAKWLKNGAGTGTTPVVTANAALAPDGTFTADRVQLDRGAGDASGDYSLLIQTLSLSPQNYTGSVFVRSANGLTQNVLIYAAQGSGNTKTVQSVGNEWVRLSVTHLPPSTATGGFIIGARGGYGGDQALDLYVWGAQLEAASFASPYIPTTTAAVTRSVEVAEIAGISSFGYQPDSSTWAIEAKVFGESGGSNQGWFIGLGSSADNNVFRGPCGVFDNRLNVGFQNPAANFPEFYNLTGQTVKVSGSHTQFAAHLASVNGVTRTANLVGAGAVDFSTFNILGIGHAGRAATKSYGTPNSALRRIRYWPALLTQEEMNALTA